MTTRLAALVLCSMLGCRPSPPPQPTPSPTMPPTPPIATPDPCPSPEPGRVHHWKVERIGVVSNWTDATPLVHSCAYCAEIGLPTLPDGVTPRCDCPVRPEDSPQRPACEREATGVTAWSCPSGGTLEIREGNPYQARCVDGQAIRVCDATETVCATRAQ